MAAGSKDGLVDSAVLHKEQGNKLFGAKKWADAVTEYTAGIEAMAAPHASSTQTVPPEQRLLRAVLFNNRAKCHLKLQQWQLAVDDATTALTTDASVEAKALFRRASVWACDHVCVGCVGLNESTLHVPFFLAPCNTG